MEKDFIFGFRAIIEAIEAQKNIDKLFLRKGIDNELANEVQNLAQLHHIPIQYVPNEKLNRITRKNHQGCIANISPIPFHTLSDVVQATFEKGETPMFLILDGITDVRNFGAICRSADGAGVNGIIIPDKNSVRISSDAVKTSAGALYHIPVCKVRNLKEAVQFLQESGLKIVAATEKAEKVIYDIDLSVPVGLIMGAEDKGVSNSLMTVAEEWTKIPLTGKISSLNVSVAAAIFMFECVRQRTIN